MVVDEVQDQRKHPGREVLPAPYGLLTGIPQGGEDVVLKSACDAVRQASEEPHYLIQTVPPVDAETGARVTGRDPEFHQVEIVGDDVQDVPAPSGASRTHPAAVTQVRRPWGAFVAGGALHPVWRVGSKPAWLQQGCT